MTDSQGYFLGILALVAVLIFRAFFAEAGKDIYRWLMHKIRSPEPEPVQVNSNFRTQNHSPNLFRWVNKIDVPKRLLEGYSFYYDPEDGAKRFCLADPETLPTERTFYMWRPGQNQTNDAD